MLFILQGTASNTHSMVAHLFAWWLSLNLHFYPANKVIPLYSSADFRVLVWVNLNVQWNYSLCWDKRTKTPELWQLFHIPSLMSELQLALVYLLLTIKLVKKSPNIHPRMCKNTLTRTHAPTHTHSHTHTYTHTHTPSCHFYGPRLKKKKRKKNPLSQLFPLSWG